MYVSGYVLHTLALLHYHSSIVKAVVYFRQYGTCELFATQIGIRQNRIRWKLMGRHPIL